MKVAFENKFIPFNTIIKNSKNTTQSKKIHTIKYLKDKILNN